LESEVIQLRSNEARLLQETKALYVELSLLKNVLAENGITSPSRREMVQESPRTKTGGIVTLTIGQEDKRKNRRKQIHVQQNNTETGSAQLFTPPLSGSTLSPTTSTITHPPCLGALDPELVGMDFVLTLESPCLPHIDVSPPTPTNHALTLSACIFHTHPSPPGQRHVSPATWEIPSASIAQLLQLSEAIPLQEGEVTPVQAWDYIRRHDQFAELDVQRWEDLKDKLVRFVRCYGFGGVIERDVFENAVFEAMVVGRVF
jgi:hypothetical protein